VAHGRTGWSLLREHCSWKVYARVIVDLIGALGEDPAAYTATALRAFILRRAQPHSAATANSTVCATRSFLRFLFATGRCPTDMQNAIPKFAAWKSASVPRFLVQEDVERVIAACSAVDALGTPKNDEKPKPTPRRPQDWLEPLTRGVQRPQLPRRNKTAAAVMSVTP